MRATAIVPIKRFDAAKQRLTDALSPADRKLLASAMASDVLERIGSCTQIDRTIVVSGEPEVASIAARAGVDLLEDPDDAGHSEAALLGIAAAKSSGAQCVALLPGDCPMLVGAELDAALAAHEPGSVGVIADRHGAGTNGLLISPPDAIEPAFGPGSRERHLQLAEQAGVRGELAEIPSMALDLDTGEDLAELRSQLTEAGLDAAPRTVSALSVITQTEPGGGAAGGGVLSG